MADYHVIDELRAYLLAQGIVQAQTASPSTTLPSIWLDPRDGARLPRDGEDVTVTLRDTMLAAPDRLQAWEEVAYIDVITRARKEPAGKLVQRSIRNLLHPISAHGGKYQWTMGSLLVAYSTVWRGDQPLPRDGDAITYDRVQSFQIACRRQSLAGQPYA